MFLTLCDLFTTVAKKLRIASSDFYMGKTELPAIKIPSVVLPSFSSSSPPSSSPAAKTHGREGEREAAERAALAHGAPVAYGCKAHAKFVTAVRWSGCGQGREDSGDWERLLLASASSDSSVVIYER